MIKRIKTINKTIIETKKLTRTESMHVAQELTQDKNQPEQDKNRKPVRKEKSGFTKLQMKLTV